MFINFFIYDTETTGLNNGNDYYYCKLVQFGYMCIRYNTRTNNYSIVDSGEYIVNREITKENEEVTKKLSNLSQQDLYDKGKDISIVLDKFQELYNWCDIIVCHNVMFDLGVMANEFKENKRLDMSKKIKTRDDGILCTFHASRGYLRGELERFRLKDVYSYFFGKEFDDQHTALADTRATMSCLTEMIKRGGIVFEKHNRPRVVPMN